MTPQRSIAVPPPRDLGAAPRVLVAELRDIIGEAECVQTCVFLLSGGSPLDVRERIAYLGGRGTPSQLEGSWKIYWARVWGARGLLYVWDASAAPIVVEGVSDPQWRVAEMCMKVAARRDLAAAADPSVALLAHELSRVRAGAARTLGLVGDAEHVEHVTHALGADETAVRRAAELAVRRLSSRLDLTWADEREGRHRPSR